MAISLKGLKKIKEESSKTIEVNLKQYIPNIGFDLILPFKIKPYKEQLNIKANTDFKREDIAGVKRVQYSKLPKDLQELYADFSPANMKGALSLITLIDHSKNEASYQEAKMQDKLLEVVMHIDMDSLNEDGISLWEEQGLQKGDFLSLVNLFSEVITSEDFLDILVFTIQGIKSNFKGDMLAYYINSQKFHQELAKVEDPEERKRILKEVQDSIDKSIEEAKDPAKAPKTLNIENKKEKGSK